MNANHAIAAFQVGALISAYRVVVQELDIVHDEFVPHDPHEVVDHERHEEIDVNPDPRRVESRPKERLTNDIIQLDMKSGSWIIYSIKQAKDNRKWKAYI